MINILFNICIATLVVQILNWWLLSSGKLKIVYILSILANVFYIAIDTILVLRDKNISFLLMLTFINFWAISMSIKGLLNSKFEKHFQKKFEEKCLKRDYSRCRMCNIISFQREKKIHVRVFRILKISSHSSIMYDIDNGITLCDACIIRAKCYNYEEDSPPGFSSQQLLEENNSSIEKLLRKYGLS